MTSLKSDSLGSVRGGPGTGLHASGKIGLIGREINLARWKYGKKV